MKLTLNELKDVISGLVEQQYIKPGQKLIICRFNKSGKGPVYYKNTFQRTKTGWRFGSKIELDL